MGGVGIKQKTVAFVKYKLSVDPKYKSEKAILIAFMKK